MKLIPDTDLSAVKHFRKHAVGRHDALAHLLKNFTAVMTFFSNLR